MPGMSSICGCAPAARCSNVVDVNVLKSHHVEYV